MLICCQINEWGRGTKHKKCIRATSRPDFLSLTCAAACNSILCDSVIDYASFLSDIAPSSVGGREISTSISDSAPPSFKYSSLPNSRHTQRLQSRKIIGNYIFFFQQCLSFSDVCLLVPGLLAITYFLSHFMLPHCRWPCMLKPVLPARSTHNFSFLEWHMANTGVTCVMVSHESQWHMFVTSYKALRKAFGKGQNWATCNHCSTCATKLKNDLQTLAAAASSASEWDKMFPQDRYYCSSAVLCLVRSYSSRQKAAG
jgi:hypothetical protein